MPTKNHSFDNATANETDTLSRDVTDRATEAKDAMSDVSRRAAEKIDEGRSTAADRWIR